ncbi:MAG TPA: MarR family transcriptional regulator [Jatrophihabitans sp.]|nr:MarR family transcriptional regulator [Jatrophihabitans sp.]
MSDQADPALSTAPPKAGGALPLSPADWRLVAWRGFLRTHTHLLRQLEQDLQAHGKIALGSYDVLVQLAEAPDNRLRMSELAEAVLLSRSGLTRLVDRMQRDGLVSRAPDPDDARGLYTVLTEQGRDALRDAANVHLAGISRLVFDRISEAELRQLLRLMRKLDPAPAPDPLATRHDLN